MEQRANRISYLVTTLDDTPPWPLQTVAQFQAELPITSSLGRRAALG